jgi:prepilin peptidase dependent protein B
MPVTCTLARQRGLSLVELMIGITVGLFVVAGASFMLSNQLHDGRRLMLETRVQQDLRAAADIVVRELRRAGYSGSAAHAAWFRGTTGIQPSSYTTITAGDSQVSFRYGVDNDNNFVATDEQFGFRLAGGAIQFQLGGGNWQALTDTDTLVVNRFTITENVQTIDLNRFCARPCIATGVTTCGPQQIVRDYDIRIEGYAPSDRTVQRSLRAAVRPRNDPVSGVCDEG